MDVNGVSNLLNVNSYSDAGKSANVTEPVKEDTNAAAEEKTDVYELSNEKVYKPDADRIKALWAEHEDKVSSFRKLIEGLFTKQSQKAGIANAPAGTNPWKGTAWENDIMINVDDATRAKAQAEIDEGGYYSVDETAKRLLDFAVALSGGDPSKVDTLRGAVEKGFKAVEDMWGGELPEISQKTYDAVMKGFDEWSEAGDSGAINLLNPDGQNQQAV